MRCLGIDQSLTTTAWVILDTVDMEVIASGTIETKIDRGFDNKQVDTIRRARIIADELMTQYQTYQCDEVAMEGMSFGSQTNATRDLAILFGLIGDRLNFDNNTGIIAPTSLKKFFTGGGKAKKEDMLVSLEEYDPKFFERCNKVPKTRGRFDLVDAYAVAYWKIEN